MNIPPEQRPAQVVETIALWGAIAVGGAGLWLCAADPMFGGPEVGVVAWTLFACFAAMGVVGTVVIWWLPARRLLTWMLPPSALPEASSVPTTAHIIGWLAFWAAALALVWYSIWNHWHPVAIGLAIASLLALRLIGEVLLNRRNRRR